MKACFALVLGVALFCAASAQLTCEQCQSLMVPNEIQIYQWMQAGLCSDTSTDPPGDCVLMAMNNFALCGLSDPDCWIPAIRYQLGWFGDERMFTLYHDISHSWDDWAEAVTMSQPPFNDPSLPPRSSGLWPSDLMFYYNMTFYNTRMTKVCEVTFFCPNSNERDFGVGKNATTVAQQTATTAHSKHAPLQQHNNWLVLADLHYDRFFQVGRTDECQRDCDAAPDTGFSFGFRFPPEHICCSSRPQWTMNPETGNPQPIFQRYCGMNVADDDPYMPMDNSLNDTFGSPHCGLAPVLFDAMMAHAAQLDHPISGIMILGDTTPGDWWMQSQEDTLETHRMVKAVLKQHFPGVPVFPVLGNHEPQPIGTVAETGDFLYDSLFDIWGRAARMGPDQEETFKHGGYYMSDIGPQLKLIVLNGNLGATTNYELARFRGTRPIDLAQTQPPSIDFGGQIAWFKSIFANPRMRGTHFLIAVHEPFSSGDWQIPYARELLEVIERNADRIAGTMYGHSHAPLIQVLRDRLTGNDTKPLLPGFVFASGTPAGHTSPTYHIVHSKLAHGDVLDIEHHMVDLAASNLQGSVLWMPTKSVRAFFNMDSLSPGDIQLRNNLAASSPAMLDKLAQHSMSWDTESVSKCTGGCKCDVLCESNGFDTSSYKACKLQFC